MSYEPRTYRSRVAPEGLVTFEVVRAETDLMIAAERDLRSEAAALVEDVRSTLDAYVASHPRFAESFVPVEVEPDAPVIVRAMAAAGAAAGVGPMAAVAGAVAEHVARGLAPISPEVVVENGGDVYVMGSRDRVAALHAGASPLSGSVGVVLPGSDLPLAACTSSATVGPSVSLGSADAALVVARDGALADAVASLVGNRVHGPEDVEAAMEAGRAVPGVLGVVVVVGETMGAWGVRLVPLAG